MEKSPYMDKKTQQEVLKAFNSVAQNAHMLSGAFIVFLPVVFHRASWLWYIIPAYIILTAWKEFWYDVHYEIPEIRGSGLRDFIHYQSWVVGLGLYFLSTLVK
jgi:hypothetical protein